MNRPYSDAFWNPIARLGVFYVDIAIRLRGCYQARQLRIEKSKR